MLNKPFMQSEVIMTQASSEKKGLGTVLTLTGITILLEQALFLMAFYILASTINWPASLGLPAETVFPLIIEKSGAVFSGYYFYLLSSVLLIPVALLIRSALSEQRDPVLNSILNTAMGFGMISGAMKIMGIIRWLFAMPMLAEVYMAPGSSEAMKQTAVINYNLLNAYAGKLGEHVGVQLLTALFIATLAAAFFRSDKISSWFGRIGIVVAIMALPYEDLLNIDLGPFLTISGTAIGFWMIGLGITFLTAGRSFKKGNH